MPVAIVDATGVSPVIYYIHTDQIWTPQKITDGSMAVVWDGVADPFGNPASGSSVALTNLRFPGQYFDAEALLHQNWNRDYDPSTGRYAQSDPNGISEEINTYTYASKDPLGFIDFYGLKTQITIWDPVGHGESSFGHASSDVNGTSYSFGPNGMNIEPASAYNFRNQTFRQGTRYTLNLSKSQENTFAQCLKAPRGSYNLLINNCTTAISQCLSQTGVRIPSQILLPRGLSNNLSRMPLTSGISRLPRTPIMSAPGHQ